MNSTVSTNFTSFTAFLEGFGYLKQFEVCFISVATFAPSRAEIVDAGLTSSS